VKHCAALLAVLAFLAACGGDEPAAHDAVYKVGVTMKDTRPEDPEDVAKLKHTAWVEWIDAVSGRWRIEVRSPREPGSSKVDSKTAIYTGSACFEDASYSPPSLRIGSRGFLGACADDSIALEELGRHLVDGREPPERFRGERGRVEFLATIVETISRAEAEERGLFETPEHVADIARELEAGEPATLPIKAYWFGPNLANREAAGAVENRLSGEVAYTTFYLPDEVQVVCRPLDDPTATKTLARLRSRTGTKATLNNGERATAFREGGALWFVTATTLVSVTGSRGDVRALAASLRPV
jgi:hypothetical protein